MKKIIKKIIFKIVEFEAKLVLLRYRPKVIAVSGTVGKTSTKELIHKAIEKDFRTRKTEKSLNSEIGVPLTILGYESGWNSIIAWIKIMIGGIFKVIYSHKYPKVLVIETGIDRPGDMDKLAKWLKPHISVISAFGSIPAHVEYFDSPEGVMKEEAKLALYTREGGSLILNADDYNVLKVKNDSHVKTYTYGVTNIESDILATNYNIEYVNDIPSGISFKAEYEGNVVPVNMKGVLGRQFIYPALAAMSVAKVMGLSPVKVVENISSYIPLPGRMNILKGQNGSVIIDDTYNSSPIALEKALEVLGDIKAKRKVAILGDILEIGRFSHSEHVKAGTLVWENKVDYLITVGDRAKSIADSAIEHGMAENHIFSFKTSEEAIEKSKKYAKEGYVILLKGSQGIRVEKITKELIDKSLNSAKLLVRQEKEWQNR